MKGGHPEELLGKTITEPGYMSTARELEPALNFIKAKKDNAVLLRIHMKGGEHAMDISDVSYFGEVEKEILFDEGQEMLITGVEPAKTKKSGGIPEEALVLDVEVKQ